MSVTVKCAKDDTQRSTEPNWYSRKIYKAKNIQIFLPVFSKGVIINPCFVILIVCLFPTVIQVTVNIGECIALL